MKERPIIFSAPMVRAILEGRKTQTRRVVKLPHNNPLGKWEPTTIGGGGIYTATGEKVPHQGAIWHTRTGDVIGCPHGEPGDRLWVRETWTDTTDLFKPETALLRYRADVEHPFTWRPSIFMPRWASRITLEITGVRVERVQDINEADASAEGVDQAQGLRDDDDLTVFEIQRARGFASSYPIARFVLLWDLINGKHPGVTNWNANPWVWVIEFRRLEQA